MLSRRNKGGELCQALEQKWWQKIPEYYYHCINHIRFKYNMIDECHSGNSNQLCLYSSLSSYHYLSHCSFPSPFFSSCDSVNYSVSVCLSTSVAVSLCFCLSVTICVSHYVYLLLIQSQSCVIHHDSFCFKQRLHHN